MYSKERTLSREQRAKVSAMLRDTRPRGLQSVEEMRAGYKALMGTMITPAGIRTQAVALGERPALLVEPADGRESGTIMYFHGGAFVFGSPDTSISLMANLVVKTGFRALSPDYRLAPENPFPAAIDDTLSAYRALLDSGTQASAIAFAGDSAGGGLSVTTCLAARDAGLPMPAAIVAFSPGLDLSRTGESMNSKAGVDPYFSSRAALDHTGAMYLAGQDPRQPMLSPAAHADLAGFPPMLVQVGTSELLLADSTRIAARATAAGVDVILDITAEAPHVFQSFAGVLDEADEALDRAALFLRQRIHGHGTTN
jgi:epsilon-lactone hydrolase